MKYLKIENDGLLDIRLIGLMGGTTKKDDKFKIGQFGTGLKYVLSFLIRSNIDFKIFVGKKEIVVSTDVEVIRQQEFNIISIDGKRTSITCQMGFEWQAWMIVREIWCNALDEGGASKCVTSDLVGADDKTTFYIQLTPEINKVLENWMDYFIHDATPFYEDQNFSVYVNKKEMCLFKNGVLIHREKEKRGLFSYDFKDAQINELREYKGSLSYDVLRCIQNFDEKCIDYFLTNVKEEHYEGGMDYDWSWTEFGEKWEQTLGSAKLITPKAIENIKARELDVDLSSVIVVPEPVFRALTKQFKGVSALRVADKINEFYEAYLPKLEQRIKEAQTILESCDYYIDPELKFICGLFGDKTKFASVNLDKKEVLFSEQMMDKSLFEVCAIMVEENEHFKTGFQDCSRQFQTHFINLFTKTLLDKNLVKL